MSDYVHGADHSKKTIPVKKKTVSRPVKSSTPPKGKQTKHPRETTVQTILDRLEVIEGDLHHVTKVQQNLTTGLTTLKKDMTAVKWGKQTRLDEWGEEIPKEKTKDPVWMICIQKGDKISGVPFPTVEILTKKYPHDAHMGDLAYDEVPEDVIALAYVRASKAEDAIKKVFKLAELARDDQNNDEDRTEDGDFWFVTP